MYKCTWGKDTKKERKQGLRALKHTNTEKKEGNKVKQCKGEESSQHRVKRITNLKQPINSHLKARDDRLKMRP